MKERWNYNDYTDDDTGKQVYYKAKQRLTWQFYLRVIKKWFTPCDKCQQKLEDEWAINFDVIFNGRKYIARVLRDQKIICNKCLNKIMKRVETSEVILGNKDYEPPVELQRRWVDIEEKNANGVWDLVSETVTKEEYYRVKGWKL